MEEVASDVWLKRQMRQTLTDMVAIRKQTARKRMFLLLGYDLTERRTRAENGAELEEVLRNQMDETRVELGDDSAYDASCTWKLKAIEDSAESGRRVNGGLEESEKEDLYFKKSMGTEVLGKFMGYEVEWQTEANRIYVNGAVMHLARLGA